MHLHHPNTIPPTPPQSVEKLSSMKPVSAAKKVGDRCIMRSGSKKHSPSYVGSERSRMRRVGRVVGRN